MFKRARTWLAISTLIMFFLFVGFVFALIKIILLSNEIVVLKLELDRLAPNPTPITTDNTLNVVTPTITSINATTTILPTGNCEPIPHQRLFNVSSPRNSRDVISDVKNFMPTYPGMRYFYMDGATMENSVETFYAEYVCPNEAKSIDYMNIVSSFKYGNLEIGFTQGYWGKGGTCAIPIDVKFLGKDAIICAEQSSQGQGENNYYGFLIDPGSDLYKPESNIEYNFAIYFSGYYSSSQIQSLLDKFVELK